MTATLPPPPPPSPASNVESRKVPLAKEFDQVRHMDGLHKMIAEKLGPEWRFARFEGPEDRPEFAIAEKVTSYITFLSDGTTGEPIQVKLNSGTKPTDAPWLAGWAAVQHPGYELVAFRPYEGWARLARLEPDASRCREAVAAVLGVGAWEVQISVQRNSRGEAIRYDLELPKYAPSKHDKGLTEVAQAIIGHEGWEVDIDGMTKKCSFIAGVHFGFSAKILPTPTPSPATANRDQLGWGERLNQGRPEVESINFEAHPHALVVGKTGSGKGVLINNLIANAVAAGWHVVLCEGVKNGTDFVDFRPFIAPGMWGCDSLAHAAAVLAKVELEYQRRRELIKANGAQKLSQLSDAVRPARWLVVIDEFATLTARDGSKGLSSADMKYLPEEMQQAEIARRMRSAMVNFGKQAIVQGAKDLAAKARFTGIHIVIASQRASTESLGGDGALRENLPWKGLLGVTSNSASALSMALNCPQDELPLVPKHLLREDEAHIRAERPGPGWLKGAGFVNADGQLVHIAKGWFFDPKRLQSEEPWRSLAAEGARAGNGTSMSVREVSKLAQIPEDVVKSLMGIKIELLQDDDAGDDGADAGLLSATVSARNGWEPSEREICGSCGTPIDPFTGDCVGCSK